MIIKPLSYPLALKQLEAIQKRLPPEHPKAEKVNQQLMMKSAGYKGEKNLEYPLSFLDSDTYSIFFDLRLFDGKHHFQMDALILSSSFIVILEVKNIAGTLYFDTGFNQLIRTYNNTQESFPDPLIQIKRQEAQFTIWCKQQSIPEIPIHSFVVISSPKTILTASPDQPPPHHSVIPNLMVHKKILELTNKFSDNLILAHELHQVGLKLLANHSSAKVNMLQTMQIEKYEIQPGVICDHCRFLPLEYVRRQGWKCSRCSKYTIDGAQKALRDYGLIINRRISTKDAKLFLKTNSGPLVRSLFKSMDLYPVGRSRSYQYVIPHA